MALTATLNDLPTIAVIYENTVFGESAAVAVTAEAEEQGVSVVAYESYQPGAQNLSAPISTIRAARPDVVYLVANSIPDSINLLQTSRAMNLNPQLFIANAGAFVSPDFLERAGEEAEYVVITAQWAEDVDWRYEDGLDTVTFANLFRERYNGAQPGMRSVQTYTSLLLAKEVIERAQAVPGCTASMGQLRLCIRTELRQINLEQTLFGAINFNESTGQNSHPVLLVQIVPDEDGYRFATVYPERFRTQELILPNQAAVSE
jgi:branched-chain amino acid transport system substrate-binding protein